MSNKPRARQDAKGKPRPPKWPQSTRARVVELYRDHSAREVSEMTGVPEGTIRVWASQSRQRYGGDPVPKDASPAERIDWAAKKEKAAEEAFTTAQEALAEVRKLIAEGEHLKAQRAALTFAITTDKSGVLEAAAKGAEERRARIDHDIGVKIVQTIKMTLSDLGLPVDAISLRRVVRHHLELANRDEPSSPAPAAADARRAVFEHVLRSHEKPSAGQSFPVAQRSQAEDY